VEGIINLVKFKIITFFAVITILLGGFVGGYVALLSNMPSIEELMRYTPTTGTRIYSDDDKLIGELKIEKGIFVPIKDIPQSLINAVISVEDSRFWKHKGIDYIAITRALFKDLIHVSLKEGGSTITQQLAKVVFLTPKKTFKRKLMEAILAIRLEKNLTKNEILELYLNKIYFGHGAYGVEMASQTYFGKSAKKVNTAEASLIVGLTKAPTTYSPYNNLRKAKTRQYVVLQRMVEEGYISEEEKEKIYKQPLYLSSLKKGTGVNSYFIEYVRKQLEEEYGIDTVYKGKLKVYTTLNREMQISAVNALQSGLQKIDKRRGWRGPVKYRNDVDFEKELKGKELSATVVVKPGDIYSGLVLEVKKNRALIKTRGVIGTLSINDARWASKIFDDNRGTTKKLKNFGLHKILKPGDVVKVSIKNIRGKKVRLNLEQEPDVQGAIVAVEPYTGFVKAMVGGYDFSKSEYNRALFAKRQPGSAFKPIIYAAALDNGFTPASIIIDEPVTYMGGPDGEWSPENYDHTYYGPTRLRDAVVYSRNVVTVKLADSMGLDIVRDYASTLGFQEKIPNDLSIALGSFNTTPFEMANVYNTFASNGFKVKPISIKFIIDRRGRVLKSNEPNPEEIISPQTSFLITSILGDVIKHGTGWRAKAIGRPVAGKTGTTNDYKDAWFAGYTPDLTACVWVGFDSFKTLGPEETGSRAASPIWVSFMNRALTTEPEEFTVPEGIVSYYIDPETGLLALSGYGIKEFFKEETEPKRFTSSRSVWELRDPTQMNFD
jgi:penicillin-binding protein 1A